MSFRPAVARIRPNRFSARNDTAELMPHQRVADPPLPDEVAAVVREVLNTHHDAGAGRVSVRIADCGCCDHAALPFFLSSRNRP